MKEDNCVINIIAVISFVIIADVAIVLNIPLYRQFLGFILLTILPGALMIKLFVPNNFSLIRKIIYSVGISISLLMFIGFLINFLGPNMGISRPLSVIPILFAINCVIATLTVLVFFYGGMNFSIRGILSNCYNKMTVIPIMCVLLILLFGVLGGLTIKYYQSSIFCVVLLILISICVIFIAYKKVISENYYPHMLFAISIAIILIRTLSSSVLFGSDIHLELFYLKLSEINGYWDPSMYPSPTSTMLSTVVLPTIYSAVLLMEGIEVYKV
ncbi:MAG: Uncharacterized protein XE11_2675, partial [Methanomicrobiales archaeon 53_19]